MKTDFDLAKNLKAGVSLFLNDSKKNGYLTDGDAFINPANYSRNANPYLQLTDEKGHYIYDPDIEGYSGRYVKFNYLEEVDNTDYTLKNRSIKPLFTFRLQADRLAKTTNSVFYAAGSFCDRKGGG